MAESAWASCSPARASGPASSIKPCHAPACQRATWWARSAAASHGTGAMSTPSISSPRLDTSSQASSKVSASGACSRVSAPSWRARLRTALARSEEGANPGQTSSTRRPACAERASTRPDTTLSVGLSTSTTTDRTPSGRDGWEIGHTCSTQTDSAEAAGCRWEQRSSDDMAPSDLSSARLSSPNLLQPLQRRPPSPIGRASHSGGAERPMAQTPGASSCAGPRWSAIRPTDPPGRRVSYRSRWR